MSHLPCAGERRVVRVCETCEEYFEKIAEDLFTDRLSKTLKDFLDHQLDRKCKRLGYQNWKQDHPEEEEQV